MSLLRKQGVEPEIVEYLKNPLNETELRSIAKKLNLEPGGFIRRREIESKEMNLKEKLKNPDALFKALALAPKLMERPIAVRGEKAVLGRPPEKVLELL